jgi:hypothetical protein
MRHSAAARCAWGRLSIIGQRPSLSRSMARLIAAWMIASRPDSKHLTFIDLDGHRARNAFGIWPVLGASQGQTSTPNPAGVNYLRQHSKQAVLRVGAGLLTDRVLPTNLDAHWS